MSDTFGEYARETCQKHGWTHERLAEALGVSAHTYASWLKEDALSARQAPEWAWFALDSIRTGQCPQQMKGEVLVTYVWRGKA